MKLGKRIIGFVVCVGIVMLGLAPAQAQGNGKRLVLNLVGMDETYIKSISDPDNDGQSVDALCHDVDLFNAKNGQRIGTATDCLSNFSDPPLASGTALVGTTTFWLPQGKIVTQGRTRVQPAAPTTITTTDGHLITHTTGASADGNSILEGTKRFKNATGTVRLSGLVDLAKFSGKDDGGSIFFDCLFVIDFD